MTPEEVLRYLGLWSAIGCALFSVFVVVACRTGIVFTARKEDGTLKKRIPLAGSLTMLIIPLGIVGLQVVANYFGIVRQAYEVSFPSLFLLNLGHYLILFLFDSVVIDGLVLSVWRPGFLRLPDAMGSESMKRHILLSIPIGTVIGIGLAVVSTVISYLTLLNR